MDIYLIVFLVLVVIGLSIIAYKKIYKNENFRVDVPPINPVNSASNFTIVKGVLTEFKGVDIFPIIVPQNVTSINSNVFSGRSIKEITLPNSITNIKYSTFEDCTSLISIILPNNLKSIEYWVFKRCTSLNSITLPDSLVSIGKEAFIFSGLRSITIPKNVTFIGDGAFNKCNNLNSINFGLNSTINNIGKDVFSFCIFDSITIPETVTSIGEKAFAYCPNLSSVNFGLKSKLNSIGDNVFNSCFNLSSITIPENVTSIGKNAFNLDLNTIIFNGDINKITFATSSYFFPLKNISIYSNNWDINKKNKVKTAFRFNLFFKQFMTISNPINTSLITLNIRNTIRIMFNISNITSSESSLIIGNNLFKSENNGYYPDIEFKFSTNLCTIIRYFNNNNNIIKATHTLPQPVIFLPNVSYKFTINLTNFTFPERTQIQNITGNTQLINKFCVIDMTAFNLNNKKLPPRTIINRQATWYDNMKLDNVVLNNTNSDANTQFTEFSLTTY